MNRHDEWTRESEAEALERLRVAAGAGRQSPIVLIYTRQSVSDFDAEGRPRGPSLNQQLDTVTRRPELIGLTVEHFEGARPLGQGDFQAARVPRIDGARPDCSGGPDWRGRLLRRRPAPSQ